MLHYKVVKYLTSYRTPRYVLIQTFFPPGSKLQLKLAIVKLSIFEMSKIKSVLLFFLTNLQGHFPDCHISL